MLCLSVVSQTSLTIKEREGSCSGKRSYKRLVCENGWTYGVCGNVSRDVCHACGYCPAMFPSVVVLSGTVLSRAKDGGGNSIVRGTSIHRYVETRKSLDHFIFMVLLAHECFYGRFAEGAMHGSVQVKGEASEGPTAHTGLRVNHDGRGEGEGVTDPCGGGETHRATLSKRQNRCFRGKKYTHFVGLPLGKMKPLRDSVELLLTSMKRCCTDPGKGVTEEIFTTAPRIHLTLLMLSLPTARHVALAVECMRVLQDEIHQWKRRSGVEVGGVMSEDCVGVPIRPSGLHVMAGRGQNVQRANVLYMGLGRDKCNSAVTELQDLVHDCFAELISDDPRVSESKLLHVTLMNTKWRRRRQAQQKENRSSHFNASDVLRHFADSSLCDDPVPVTLVELCAVGYDKASECYHCEAAAYL